MAMDEALHQEMMESPNDHVVAGTMLWRGRAFFFEKEERERAAVLSTARRHAKFLGYESMEEVLSESDLRSAETR